MGTRPEPAQMEPHDREDWPWRELPPLAPPAQRIDGSPLVVLLAWGFACLTVVGLVLWGCGVFG